MKGLFRHALTVTGAALLIMSTAWAGGIPETQVTVIGTNSAVRHAVIPEKGSVVDVVRICVVLGSM